MSFRWASVDRHVVRHVVDDDAEPLLERRIEQGHQPVLATELGAHLRVIDDVVPVQAPRNRLGDRREVEVTHTQRHEMIEQPDRFGETERRGQLDPIGRNEFWGLLHLQVLPVSATRTRSAAKVLARNAGVLSDITVPATR